MAFRYQKNNSIVTPWAFAQKYTTPSLCYRQGGATFYIPLIAFNSKVYIDGYKYMYNYSQFGKSIAVRYNGNTYYVPNDRIQQSPAIGAGTYSPANFENLIKNYISNNGYRVAAQDFAVTVNGQKVVVKAGDKVYYTVNSSSPMGFVRHVGFAEHFADLLKASCSPSHGSNGGGFSAYKQYVTYCSTGSGFEFVQLYRTYSYYSITVNTPIYFN